METKAQLQAQIKALKALNTTEELAITRDNVETATVANATEATSIFRATKALATEILTCKLVFIAPSQYGLRLVVSRADQPNANVYCFPEIVTVAGVKPGMQVSMLVEQVPSSKDGKLYWNVNAIAQI